jgi:peroxiredoxin
MALEIGQMAPDFEAKNEKENSSNSLITKAGK